MIENNQPIITIQINLLIQAIHERYGYDFHAYVFSSLERRLEEFMKKEAIDNYYHLIDNILHSKDYFEKFLSCLSVNVTEMFRDPIFFDNLRKKVIPALKTYPSLKIWIAGCSTGEEAFSIAILLAEEGLLNRTKIYATDINDALITRAKQGVYSIDHIKLYTENYNKFKGKADFSDYYHARYDSAVIAHNIRKHIAFFQHNLAMDGIFNTFHLILCRNVLIYFDRSLQNRALQLLSDSLENSGYLCLGLKETLSTTAVENFFTLIDRKGKIYKKLHAGVYD